MKAKLLLVLLLAATGLSAQTTHTISWFMGVPSSQTTMTIEVGDTVKWTWDDTAPHTVTSQAGGAESFNSGTLTGNDKEFSHTFTVEGSTSYRCNIHASMQGTITVQSVAAVGDNKVIDFQYYPNPVTDVLTITSGNIINKVTVYDMTGRVIMTSTADTPNVKIYMDSFVAGTYIVTVNSEKASKNITVVKK
ncbi:T9SS type A sorting domain-containing protein [Flavobacterium salilacus subsp. salilacus]|uniref:T9SS type A sorting domain-containing protein n=1 Tax=Flavobacterium TaxID=237 RepID=UPI00107545E0|nr:MULTISPECIES: T9SS type A sorting domain-containing protein [Flavobacterium]KAF2518484.1 T9SS type A sorting domain-containing protein [Flavobacterium salilacus subsp. salilacus]MBE1615123.1 T9SS type A sorting domain-containing protein [Flavobacterium sp. SaA2.13]